MRNQVVAALGAFAFGMIGDGANAADMSLPPLVYAPSGAQQPVELGSGWYLRGDLGYVDISSPTPNPLAANGSQPAGNGNMLFSNNNSRIGALGATLGAGYQFNNWFRMDLTYDWRSPIQNKSTSAQTCDAGITPVTEAPTNPTTCSVVDQSSLNSWTGLVNAYADLGVWGGVTPYIGGGVGVTHLNASAQENWYWASGLPYGNNGLNNYCPGTDTSGAVTNTCIHYGYLGNQGPVQIRNNFSWALMAGFAYDIAPHLKLDIGYRYLSMGILSAVNASGAVVHRAIDLQEVRAGLRFTPDL